MSSKYALIYWIKSGEVQVIESNKIPVHSKFKGATAKLKWYEPKTKQTINLDAKIVELSDNQQSLEELEVDEKTGEILVNKTKAFTGDVLSETKMIKNKNKDLKQRQYNSKIEQEKKIRDDISIFEKSNKRKIQSSSNSRKILKSSNTKISLDFENDNLSETNTNFKANPSAVLSRRNVMRNQWDDDSSTSNKENSKIHFPPNNHRPLKNKQNYDHNYKKCIPQYRSDNSDTDEDDNNSNTYSEVSKSNAQINCNKKSDIINAVDDQEYNDDDDISDNIETNDDSGPLFFIPGVTLDQIRFQENVLKSMKYSLEKEHHIALEEISKLLKEVFTKSVDKVEIVADSKCYLQEFIMSNILDSNNCNKDWKKMVNELMIQIYGKYLKYISVKGTRSHIAVNNKIYNAVYKLINSLREKPVSMKIFSDHLNRLFTNRRRPNTVSVNSTSNLKQKKSVKTIKNGINQRQPPKVDNNVESSEHISSLNRKDDEIFHDDDENDDYALDNELIGDDFAELLETTNLQLPNSSERHENLIVENNCLSAPTTASSIEPLSTNQYKSKYNTSIGTTSKTFKSHCIQNQELLFNNFPRSRHQTPGESVNVTINRCDFNQSQKLVTLESTHAPNNHQNTENQSSKDSASSLNKDLTANITQIFSNEFQRSVSSIPLPELLCKPPPPPPPPLPPPSKLSQPLQSVIASDPPPTPTQQNFAQSYSAPLNNQCNENNPYYYQHSWQGQVNNQGVNKNIQEWYQYPNQYYQYYNENGDNTNNYN